MDSNLNPALPTVCCRFRSQFAASGPCGLAVGLHRGSQIAEGLGGRYRANRGIEVGCGARGDAWGRSPSRI